MFSPYSVSESDRRTLAQQSLSVTARSGRGRPRKARPPLDLFGQVPVTYEECREWIARHAPAWHGARLESWYAVAYQVPAKVAREKLAPSACAPRRSLRAG